MTLISQARTVRASDLTPAQQAFPELSMSGDRALPTTLFRDRFHAQDIQYSSAERIVNWVTQFHPTLVVSGCNGVGKSVLMWQVMQAASENRSMVPLLISGPDLVAQQSLEKPYGAEGRAFPYSNFRDLRTFLDRLDDLKQRGYEYGRSMLVIIDGIDPAHYSPKTSAAIQTLERMKSHHIHTILSVDSEQNIYQSGSPLEYQKRLNPEGISAAAVVLHSAGDSGRALTKHDFRYR